MNVHRILEEIGEALVAAIDYRVYPVEKINLALGKLDEIYNSEDMISIVEDHLRSSGSNYVLFYISNIIYNLKTKNKLHLSPDALKWLASVWRNFLNRNKSYQELLPQVDDFRKKFQKYFGEGASFVNQIENIVLVKQDYFDKDKPEDGNTEMKSLERFHNTLGDILSWMKPTYFFLLDYYYERKLATGEYQKEATMIEQKGLVGYGEKGYTYYLLMVLYCQSTALLEAIYLILKIKNTTKRITTISGKQKFVSPLEIYNYYRDKFIQVKKELASLK